MKVSVLFLVLIELLLTSLISVIMLAWSVAGGKSALAAAAAATSVGSEAVDVSRLNMRIGRIVDVQKHPDADSLYVEQVDVGEGKHRTVVSGLVKHVPLEQVKHFLVIIIINYYVIITSVKALIFLMNDKR